MSNSSIWPIDSTLSGSTSSGQSDPVKCYSAFPKAPALQEPHHQIVYGGARGVVVIVVGNGHGDTSSNPGRDWLHFT